MLFAQGSKDEIKACVWPMGVFNLQLGHQSPSGPPACCLSCSTHTSIQVYVRSAGCRKNLSICGPYPHGSHHNSQCLLGKARQLQVMNFLLWTELISSIHESKIKVYSAWSQNLSQFHLQFVLSFRFLHKNIFYIIIIIMSVVLFLNLAPASDPTWTWKVWKQQHRLQLLLSAQ